MAEIDNENQDGGQSEAGESEERSFGELEEREDSEIEGGSETEEESTGETEEETKEEELDVAGEEGEGNQAGKEGKEELTEKGTKLDKNPLSAAHQQLANEKKIRSQMEQVLANPDLLAKFMKTQYGIDIPTPSKDGGESKNTPVPEVKEYKAEDFEKLEDVANVVNGIQSSFMSKIKEQGEIIEKLGTTVNSLLQGGNAQRLYQTMSEEVSDLRNEPELDPKSPDYIEGLEGDISNMYHKLDFDEKTQTYRGEYSIAEIGRDIIASARKARQKGSQKAQTVVKDKSQGAIRTGSKVKEDVNAEEKSAGSSIAEGVSKLFG